MHSSYFCAILSHYNVIQRLFDIISYCRFSVIMLTDQFDASVVILRRRLCWDYSDVFYKTNIVTGGGKREHMTQENIDKLLSVKVNYGEKVLYDKFNETWWSQPEVKDPSFWKEVSHFTLIP